MEVLAVPVLLAVGGLLALQAAANVQLSAAMASPLGASTLQLGLGAVLLLALAVVAGSLGAFVLLDQAEPWHLIGGLAAPSTSPPGSCSSRAWAPWSPWGCSSPASGPWP